MNDTRRRVALTAVLAAAACVCAASCGGGTSSSGRAGSSGERQLERLASAMAPESSPAQRNGLAAAILIDVSGSMAQTPKGSVEPKIVSARRAALDLVAQFARYAADHPSEPVLLGIYEFSRRSGAADAREVIPMGPPRRDLAERAVAAMQPDGDTPIGEAMITGKRALDATGLSHRHLLVITDGKNTKGYTPEEVAAAMGLRPETERPSLYFVAFDTNARQFDEVKRSGAVVFEAADSRALNETLDALLRGEILVER